MKKFDVNVLPIQWRILELSDRGGSANLLISRFLSKLHGNEIQCYCIAELTHFVKRTNPPVSVPDPKQLKLMEYNNFPILNWVARVVILSSVIDFPGIFH